MLKLFHKVSPEIVTITIEPQNISCAWFNKKKKNNLFVLNNYSRFIIDDLSIYHLNIFNSKRIGFYLKNFLLNNKIENSFIYFLLSGDQIEEKLLYNNYKIDNDNEDLNKLATNIYRIHQEDNFSIFYQAKIQHSLIFQYKLLAIQSRINLSRIIPENIACFQVLKFFKPELIKNKMSLDEIKTNFNNFIDYYNIEDCIIIPKQNINIENEKKFLMKNLGIFLLKDFA